MLLHHFYPHREEEKLNGKFSHKLLSINMLYALTDVHTFLALLSFTTVLCSQSMGLCSFQSCFIKTRTRCLTAYHISLSFTSVPCLIGPLWCTAFFLIIDILSIDQS